jgi:hypothetical protein
MRVAAGHASVSGATTRLAGNRRAQASRCTRGTPASVDSLAASSRVQSRRDCGGRSFSSPRDVCARRFVSLHERAHARSSPNTPVTCCPGWRACSRIISPRRQRRFPDGFGDRHGERRPGAAISGFVRRRRPCKSNDRSQNDQGLVCLERGLGRVLELVFPRFLLRPAPSRGGRGQGLALRRACCRSGRLRNGPAGRRGGGDRRHSDRRAAAGNSHSSAGPPGSTPSQEIVASGRDIEAAPEARFARCRVIHAVPFPSSRPERAAAISGSA